MNIPQGYKQTELGIIPEDWEIKTINDISQKPSYGVGAEAIPYNGKVKYIRITDIDNESHIFSPSPLTSPTFYNNKHIVSDNDILIARTGASVGKSYIYNKSDGLLVYAGFLMKINIYQANSKYIFYNTLIKRYFDWIESESARTGQPGLNLKQINTFSLPIPTIEEQQAIAEALSDVDALIAALDKKIAKKRLIKQGAMQQLLTGKKRLCDFSDDWTTKRLGDFAKLLNGYTFRSEIYSNIVLYKIITIANVQKGQLDMSNYNSIEYLPADIQSHQILKIGDILISMTGNVGRVCIVDTNNCLLNQRVGLIDVSPKIVINREFLFNVLYSPQFEDAMIDRGQGAAQANISKSDIENYIFSLPTSIHEQQAIATILSDMDKEIADLEARRDKYKLIKSGMMQKLLTGQIRLI